MSFKTVLLTR